MSVAPRARGLKEKMVLVDNHVHALKSGISGMVNAAVERRVEFLSITEHVYQFMEVRKYPSYRVHPIEGKLFSLGKFVEAIHKVAEQRNKSTEVGLGIELDYPIEDLELWSSELSSFEWDIILCSVHSLDGTSIDAELPRHLNDSSTRWARYFSLMNEAIDSDSIPFNVISHPTRLALSSPQVPANFVELLRNMVENACRRNLSVEVNVDDFLANPALVQQVMAACARSGTHVSVGTDSHDIHELHSREPIVRKLLKKAEFSFATYHRGRPELWKSSFR